MNLRALYSVRSLLALVVAVALLLGAITEIRNHAERDDLFSKVMSSYMAANWHHREAIHCRAQTSPYPQAERAKVNRGFSPDTLPAPLKSWPEEASFHEEWGRRLGEKAEAQYRQLEAIHAKLLFP